MPNLKIKSFQYWPAFGAGANDGLNLVVVVFEDGQTIMLCRLCGDNYFQCKH